MNTPKSKADVDPNFDKQLRALKEHARDAAEAGKTADQEKWHRPTGWNGDPTDVDGLGTPFDRKKANDDLVAAISDQDNPGVTGDVVATTLMIDALAVMERAFRVRHTLRRVRGAAHRLGRLGGQGDDKGPFIQLGVEHVRNVVKQAKKPA